jgi:hypothetical protein
MPQTGDCYYPDGLPDENELNVIAWRNDYLDPDGHMFSVVYTDKQITKQAETGMFTPYMPLMFTPPAAGPASE